MTLFTTLQQFVPQQQLSELAGRLAASRHPLVKRAFIRSFAKAYNITHCGCDGLRFRLTATSGNDVVSCVEGV